MLRAVAAIGPLLLLVGLLLFLLLDWRRLRRRIISAGGQGDCGH